MASLNHAGLQGYMLRARFEPGAPLPDGSIALVFDGNMRVVMHPFTHGDIVFEAQVRELPQSPMLADNMLIDALTLAGRRDPLDSDCLVLSPDQDRLMLQKRVGAAASADEFEIGLGRFLDALTGWRARFGVL